MITVEINNGVPLLSIEGEMTIYTALEQKEQLLQTLAACSELEINLAKVSELDTAGMQLLLLMKMEAMKEGKKVSIVEYGTAFLDAFNLYHLKRQFGASVILQPVA